MIEIGKTLIQPYEVLDWKFDKITKKWIKETKSFKAIYNLKEIK